MFSIWPNSVPADMIGPMQRFSGILITLVSATAYGFLPIFARWGEAAGVGTITMLFMRFSFAAVLMFIYMFIRKLALPRGRILFTLILMGALGYVGQSFCYFTSLKYSSAALTALLLYLYPVIVSILSVFVNNEALTGRKILALLLALSGTALLVGGGGGTLPGVLFGIGAALIYSVYIVTGSRVIPAGTSVSSSAVIMLGAACIYGFLTLITGFEPPDSFSGYAAISGLSLISTVIAMVTFFVGMARIGASQAALVSNFEPVVSVLAAALLLGESLTLGSMIGGCLIISSLLVLGIPKRAKRRLRRV